MRIPTILLGVTLAAGTTFALSTARPLVQDDGEPVEMHDETVLETHMLTVKATIRALRRSLKDPAKSDEALASISEMQAAILGSKGEAPRMLERIPEADRAEFVKAYRLEMIRLMQHALDLESAVLNGDEEQTKSVFDALRKLEDPAHEKFTDGE